MTKALAQEINGHGDAGAGAMGDVWPWNVSVDRWFIRYLCCTPGFSYSIQRIIRPFGEGD